MALAGEWSCGKWWHTGQEDICGHSPHAPWRLCTDFVSSFAVAVLCAGLRGHQQLPWVRLSLCNLVNTDPQVTFSDYCIVPANHCSRDACLSQQSRLGSPRSQQHRTMLFEPISGPSGRKSITWSCGSEWSLSFSRDARWWGAPWALHVMGKDSKLPEGWRDGCFPGGESFCKQGCFWGP